MYELGRWAGRQAYSINKCGEHNAGRRKCGRWQLPSVKKYIVNEDLPVARVHLVRRVNWCRQPALCDRVRAQRDPRETISLQGCGKLAERQQANVSADLERVALQRDGCEWRSEHAHGDETWNQRPKRREGMQYIGTRGVGIG